MTGNDVEEL